MTIQKRRRALNLCFCKQMEPCSLNRCFFSRHVCAHGMSCGNFLLEFGIVGWKSRRLLGEMASHLCRPEWLPAFQSCDAPCNASPALILFEKCWVVLKSSVYLEVAAVLGDGLKVRFQVPPSCIWGHDDLSMQSHTWQHNSQTRPVVEVGGDGTRWREETVWCKPQDRIQQRSWTCDERD